MEVAVKNELSVELPGEVRDLPLEVLDPGPPQPGDRRRKNVRGLVRSIKKVGLLYPLIVRPNAELPSRYVIVAGRRRFRALSQLGCESAPCIVMNSDGNTTTAEVLRVVENSQRENLDPLEEASDVRKLLDLGLESQAVAQSLGKSRTWVARRASLTELSDRWLEEYGNPETRISSWPASHLEAISRFPMEVQDQILETWGSRWQWDMPAFRDLVSLTGQFLHLLSAVSWPLEDDTLSPEAGACNTCPKRSSQSPDLFSGELAADDGKPASGDRCLDSLCWQRKADVFLTRKAEILRHDHPDLVLLNNGERDEREVPSAFQDAVYQADEVAVCRKSDPHAIPALVVAGPGMGRVKWIQSGRPQTNAQAARRQSTAEEDKTPAEKTPEEKRKPYDKRRRQVVIETVKAKLEALAIETVRTNASEREGGPALLSKGLALKTLVLLSALLDEFGWKSALHRGSLSLPEGFTWEGLSSLKNHELGSAEQREAALDLCWSLLRIAVSKLAARLLVGSGENNNQPHYDEVATLCAMLGFNLSALRNDAGQAVPYAKIWRDQVTDDWVLSKPEPAASEAN